MDRSDKGTMGASFTTGPDGETPERPSMRLMVVGDFSRGQGDPGDRATRVDRDSFKEVLAGLSPQLFLEVEDLLSGGEQPLQIALSVSDLKDLDPGAVIQQVPQLVRAVELAAHPPGEALARLAAYEDLGALCRAVRMGVSKAKPAPGPPGPPAAAAKKDKDAAVGRILDLVDAGDGGDGGARSAAASAVSSFVSQIGSRNRAASAQDPAASPVEQLVGRQLDAILHHPDFLDLEATWRGLRFLVQRTDFRSGVQLEILDTRRAALAETFHKGVYLRECEELDDLPLSLVALGFELDNTPDDLHLLEAIGPEAEEIQAPVLFSVGGGFFGLDPDAETSTMPFVDTLLEQPQYTKWNALRDHGWTRWLAAAFNGFALRMPHKQDTLLRYHETPGDNPWGSPVWAVASLITNSHARVGWPTEITGHDNGRVEDLPLHPDRHFPLQSLLAQELANDLTAAGFIPLASPAQSDAGFVFRAPTLHRAPRGGRLTSSLPYQLLAARLASSILSHKADLMAGKAEPEARAALEGFLAEMLASTGAGAAATVSISEDPEEPSMDIVSLELRTGRRVLGGARVELGFRVAR